MKKKTSIKTQYLPLNRYKTYNKLEVFKENYFIDYSRLSNDITYIEYLKDLESIYKQFYENKSAFKLNININEITLNNLDNNEKKIIKQPITFNVEKDEYVYSIIIQHNQIFHYLKTELEKEKVTLSRYSTILRNDKVEEAIEFPNTKQTQKIGLLIQSGIVDFLRNEFPNITNNQIAGFFELISQEPLKQKSTNTHFTKDKSSSKYPIQNKLDETELNLILSQFGMKKD